MKPRPNYSEYDELVSIIMQSKYFCIRSKTTLDLYKSPYSKYEDSTIYVPFYIDSYSVVYHSEY